MPQDRFANRVNVAAARKIHHRIGAKSEPRCVACAILHQYSDVMAELPIIRIDLGTSRL